MLRSRACTMFDVEFQELTATIEFRGHESLTNSVHFVLCDPPYNIRREKEKENSGHDILTKADIDDAVLLFYDDVAKGGHGIVFCSAVQFHDWYESLSTWVLSDEEFSQDFSAESGRAQTQSFAFHVEQVPNYFIRERGTYQQNPYRRGLLICLLSKGQFTFGEKILYLRLILQEEIFRITSSPGKYQALIQHGRTVWTTFLSHQKNLHTRIQQTM